MDEPDVLFESETHRNILLPSFDEGHAVPANQHLIVHGRSGMLLDPGGHKVYNKVLAATTKHLAEAKLEVLFLSHQDPDIVAAVNGWLMTTDAVAYASQLWIRFIPHFGLDKLVLDRLTPIPDEGMKLDLDGATQWILPAHFLHSCGNFQVYDETSKILYTGDLGAALGMDYRSVPDFDAHLQYMQGFHERYMGGNAAMKAWAEMVSELEIEIIAPQHGAYFKGKEMVGRFIDWAGSLRCGIDIMSERMKLPT